MTYLIVYLICINIAAFFVCWADKRRARRHRRRIPEKTLLTLCAVGGAFGHLAAMLIFRHKTRHLRFQIIVPAFCLLWILIVGYIVYYKYYI